MKPVLMIGYTYYGTDPRVIREAEAAVEGGFEVDVIDLRRDHQPPMETVRNVRVYHLAQTKHRGAGRLLYVWAYLEFFVRCTWKATSLFWRRRYGVIHVNNMPDFLVFSTLIPKLFGAKVILDIHDPMPETFVSKFRIGENGMLFKALRLQERISAWYADRVVTVHEAVKERILVPHGIDRKDIDVVANFADENIFALQSQYVVNGHIEMVFHGTILERYGLADLVEAVARMSPSHRAKFHLRIIGEGDYSARLAALIAARDLEREITFDNRMYPLHSMPAHLSESNVGIVPPLESSPISNYALPLKLLEYVALGLPVVTIRNEAIAHYFGKDDCIFYDPRDPDSLRRVLDRLAADPGALRGYRDRVVDVRRSVLWGPEKRRYVALLKSLSGQATTTEGAYS